jgi:hypothetical protein
MPRFFFHLYNDMVARDEEGKEFPSLRAAHENAIREARQLACASVLEGHLTLKHRIEIADESGQVLATVRFGDAVEVR